MPIGWWRLITNADGSHSRLGNRAFGRSRISASRSQVVSDRGANRASTRTSSGADFNCRDNQVTRLRNEPSSGAATSVLVWIWVVRRSAVTVIGPAESGTLNVADRTPSFGRIGQAQVWVRCKPSRNRLPDGDAETRRQTKAQLPDQPIPGLDHRRGLAVSGTERARGDGFSDGHPGRTHVVKRHCAGSRVLDISVGANPSILADQEHDEIHIRRSRIGPPHRHSQILDGWIERDVLPLDNSVSPNIAERSPTSSSRPLAVGTRLRREPPSERTQRQRREFLCGTGFSGRADGGERPSGTVSGKPGHHHGGVRP